MEGKYRIRKVTDANGCVVWYVEKQTKQFGFFGKDVWVNAIDMDNGRCCPYYGSEEDARWVFNNLTLPSTEEVIASN